eukprot:384423_1
MFLHLYIYLYTQIPSLFRSRELSEEEAKRWVTLKICAGLSHAKYNIIHGKCIWEEYTDKKGKLCKKRKTHDDGTVASYGCSRYMMDKGMNAIISNPISCQ